MCTQFSLGDVLVWTRYDEKLVCTVLEIRPANTAGYQRAKLRVDGWASTTWEFLDDSFVRLSDIEKPAAASNRGPAHPQPSFPKRARMAA